MIRPLLRAHEWLNTSDVVMAHWLRAARDALFGEMPILAGGTALFAIFAVVPTPRRDTCVARAGGARRLG